MSNDNHQNRFDPEMFKDVTNQVFGPPANVPGPSDYDKLLAKLNSVNRSVNERWNKEHAAGIFVPATPKHEFIRVHELFCDAIVQHQLSKDELTWALAYCSAKICTQNY